MNGRNTQKVYPIEEFDIIRDLSARTANTNVAVLRLEQRVNDLAEQLLKTQLHQSELDRDTAEDTATKLDEILDEIRNKREALIPQMARAEKDSTEKLVLVMMDDLLQQREQRTVQERDAAILARDRAKNSVSDSSQKIAAVKMDNPKKVQEASLSWVEKGWIWYRDKALPYFVTGATLIILNALWEYFKTRVNVP